MNKQTEDGTKQLHKQTGPLRLQIGQRFPNRTVSDLLDGQLQHLWQTGCQHSDEEWGGGAADVQHAGW